jgi:hypothetical protein
MKIWKSSLLTVVLFAMVPVISWSLIHSRRRFLHSRISTSRKISQDNEFHGPSVLTRELSRVGFKVVTAGFYPYIGNFAPGRLDGREIVAAIGLKE